MSENTQEYDTLPNESISNKLLAVSTMLRNCLLVNNERLKELDFTHLQMRTSTLSNDDVMLVGRVLVKANALSRYRLETNQTFQYTRVEASEGLNQLGFTGRTFHKDQYSAVEQLLKPIGELTIISGNVAENNGDATVRFEFGTRSKGNIPAKYIELASNDINKSDYGLAFRGTVDLVFKGKEVVEPPKPDEPEEPYIDVASLFLHRNLGSIL